jgi:hypothetical protein
LSAEARTISLPTSVEPVKATFSTPACAVIAAPAVWPYPVSRLTTPLGDAGFVNQPVEQQSRKWGFLSGFHEQAAARRQRRRELRTGVEDRAVPREDQPHNAIGLFQRVGVHVDEGVGRDAVGLHVVGDAVELGTPAGVVAEELGARRHLQGCLHQRHAGVQRVELGEFVGVLVDQIGDLPHDLGPLAARQLRPDAGLEGRLRPRDGFVDGLFAAVGEFGDLLLGGRVDDRDDVTRAGAFADVVQN